MNRYWRIVLHPYEVVEIDTRENTKGTWRASWNHTNDIGTGKTPYDAVMDLAFVSKDRVREIVAPFDKTAKEMIVSTHDRTYE